MGSWTELDAIYPPGTLSPGAALIVALAHAAGATSIFARGRPAAFIPRGRGLPLDADLLERAEHWLVEQPIDRFCAEARGRLNPQQRRSLLGNLLAVAGRDATAAPRVGLLLDGLGATEAELDACRAAAPLPDDLSIFPQ